METLVKHTREVGTSAGVLLPRKWLNKQVVVTLFYPSREEIAKDIIEILVKKELNEDVKGVYLFGSYARDDYDSSSDIDVLVITNKINKLINYGDYEIMLVSEKNFSKNLGHSLMYLSILKEIKVIINKELIEKYLRRKQKISIRKSLREIRKMVKINRETVMLLKEHNKNIPDGVIYSIVLRLRELLLIRFLFANKVFSKDDFLDIIGEKIYSAYSRIKRNKREINDVRPDEVIPLIDLSEKWLRELRK